MVFKRNYTPAEAAKELGVAQSTIYQYIEKGYLQAKKRGPAKNARIVIPASSLNSFKEAYR